MSYHKFSNLREILSGDLVSKLLKGVESIDFMDRDCNCNARTKVNGVCAFGGDCRKSIVVYQAECKTCGHSYLGNTQQKLKTRMNQHFAEVKDQVNRGRISDTFASHFASHFAPGANTTTSQAREMVKMKILWQGKAISCMKSFGQLGCSLCMRERLEILKISEKNANENKLINTCGEIYGACRHKTKFHRYTMNNITSTDDGTYPERVDVPGNDVATNSNSLSEFENITTDQRYCIEV